MSSLISSSRIDPLRDLVLLRQKQESVLEQKDLEIEAMRAEKAGLNDQVHRLEGELYKAKLENRSIQVSPKPTPDAKMATLMSTIETLRTKIANQANHIKGLSEKYSEFISAAGRKDEAINAGKYEQTCKQPSISKSAGSTSTQPILESVKSTVTPQTDLTPMINTLKPQDSKSDTKSAVLSPPPGMGKKAQKKARAAERFAKLAALPLKMVEAIPAGLERPSDTICQHAPGPVIVDGPRKSSPGLSQVSISQKQTTITTKPGKGTNTNLTTLTVRPILRWPNIEKPNIVASGNSKMDLTTCAQTSESSRLNRAPTGPKTVEGVMTNDCGMAVRGRGQVQGTRSDDRSSRLRVDAWNACPNSAQAGTKNIEVEG